LTVCKITAINIRPRRFGKSLFLSTLAYLLLNNIYIPMSEYETVSGRADIFLQRNPNVPQVKYEWVWELKYCKSNAKKTEINQKRKEGLEELNQYITSNRLKNRPNLKSALLIFIGKNKYEINENDPLIFPKNTDQSAPQNVNKL
jgi:hypothetical protein